MRNVNVGRRFRGEIGGAAGRGRHAGWGQGLPGAAHEPLMSRGRRGGRAPAGMRAGKAAAGAILLGRPPGRPALHPPMPKNCFIDKARPCDLTCKAAFPVDDPVDPVDPVCPVAPVDPVDPVDPVCPVAPVEPVDPVDPVDPV